MSMIFEKLTPADWFVVVVMIEYLAAAVLYWRQGSKPDALMFFAYGLANVALIWRGLR